MKSRDIIINTLCVVTAIICMALTFWGNIKNDGVLSTDAFIGTCTTLIGVCATIIVGFQIASFFKIQENEKQLEQLKAEREIIQKEYKDLQDKMDFLETNLSNAFVLVASKSDDNAFKSLAYMTSIYCDSFKNTDAEILLNRYKALFECLSKTNNGEQAALSTLLYKLKNINIPNNIDHYTEIIGLHAEILKTLEDAAKEQNG